jgi:transcriptional regulator with XRE-family HTH domain
MKKRIQIRQMTLIRQVLARNLKAYRYALGWSQAKLAERVNTSTHYIGMIEIGKKFPSPEMIEKLANALGIESPELFSKELAPPDTVKHIRKTTLLDINGLIGRFIEEKLEELNSKSYFSKELSLKITKNA